MSSENTFLFITKYIVHVTFNFASYRGHDRGLRFRTLPIQLELIGKHDKKLKNIKYVVKSVYKYTNYIL